MKYWINNSSESLNWKLLGWLGAGLVIFGYYLNANQNISSWVIWIAGNGAVGLYSIHKKAYSTAVMSFIIVIINIYGYLRWLS